MRLAAALVLGAAVAAGVPARAADVPTVTTQATARDRLPNTVADVQLGIEAAGRTVAEVQAALAAGAKPLLAYLVKADVQRLRTQAVNIQPDFDPNPGRGQAARIVGYHGRAVVSFQLEAPRLGAVLGDALNNGANTIDSANAHPREAELDDAHHRLAAAATRIALDEARAVAEAAGQKAGAIQRITVGAAPMPYPMAMPAPAPALRAMAAGPPIATEAGDSEVTAAVTVVVALTVP